MALQIVMSNIMQSEITDIQGYWTITRYSHYFLPGRLKLHTKVFTIRLVLLEELIFNADKYFDGFDYKTRRVDSERWLPMNEMPYPGYCRAPGSSRCLETFCNCKALKERWKIYLKSQKKQINKNKINVC